MAIQDGVPDHVVILGLGPSMEAFVDLAKRMGGSSAFCNEVWGINAVGDVLRCDRVFHMDDVRIQEIRAEAKPDSNIANMLRWMRRHPGPIYTSRNHADYPGLVEYPLADVVDHLGWGYFNSTAAYAVAYAIHIGVKQISCFGMDFTYPNAHHAEKGRACVEFWLGQAAARGIQVGFPAQTSLMDALSAPADRFYGYDTIRVDVQDNGELRFFEAYDLPTAEQIEAAYDHGRHPNPLVK